MGDAQTPGPPVRFLQISDSHVQSVSRYFRGVDTIEALRTAVERIDPTLDFVIHTGDLISRPATEASYDVYESVISKSPVPVWHIPGNHDDPAIMAKRVGAAPNEYPWLRTVNGIRFLGFDSSSGTIGEVQGQQAIKMLDSADSPEPGKSDVPVVIFLHHHICPMESSWLNPYALEDTHHLEKIVRRFKVICFVHGHIHHAAKFTFCGVPVFSAPALAAQFEPYGKYLELAADPPGSSEFSVTTDAVVTRTIIWYPPTGEEQGDTTKEETSNAARTD